MSWLKFLAKCPSESVELQDERLSRPSELRRLIEVERARADRSGLSFVLVVFHFGNEKSAVVSAFARSLADRIRTIDHAGRLENGDFAAILGDTDSRGAMVFVEHLLERVAPELHPSVQFFVYPDAELPTPDDVDDDDHSQPAADHVAVSRGGSSNPSTSGKAVPPGADLKQGKPDSGRQATSDTAVIDAKAFDQRHARQRTAGADALGVTVQPLSQVFIRPLPLWKRGIDLLAASIGLLLLTPLLLTVVAAIKLTSPGPVLFTQLRTGLGGRTFKIYKFRTMCVDAEQKKKALRQYSEQDGPAFKMTDDPRITPIGKILRKTCIDELPQLWNVLLGDMTLVGPRPLPVDEADGCSQWQRRRVEVTPGLTCIWQVYGKSKVSFADWMRMDIRYIRLGTFGRDMRLIVRTLLAVLTARASK